MENTQTELETAAEGLLMMSEADYPFTYITTNSIVNNIPLALQLAGKPEGTLVELTNIDYLLRNMTDASTGSVTAEDAVKFQNFVAVIKRELKISVVYRVGIVQVDVFILGTASDGLIAGMRTKLIET